MSNVINVAKKEFLDLLNNRLIVAIIAVYAVVGIFSLCARSDYLQSNRMTFSGLDFLNVLSVFLTGYGSLVALAIGFFTIQSERRDHALNTLVAKPVYRDTVINGKLLGTAAFLLLLFAFAVIVYSGGLLVFFGDMFVDGLPMYVQGMPVALLVSMVYVSIFFAIAMFLSVFTRNEAFALFISVLIWFFFLDIVPNVLFAGNLSLIFTGDLGKSGTQLINSIAMLSPSSIRTGFFIGTHDLYGSLSSNIAAFCQLLLYVLIPIVLSYIAFVRRDIA